MPDRGRGLARPSCGVGVVRSFFQRKSHSAPAARLPGLCPGPPQKELTREQRLQNARGAFGCRPGTDLTGRRVLLIDDIITTGATASACALALLEAGAVEVTAVAIAAAEELPKSRKKPPETKP